jgi:hypothetical protein
MRTIINKEKCMFCYTYLKESKNRVTCPLITIKQLGGLIYPISDVVAVVNFANRNVNLLFLSVSLYFCIEEIIILKK